MKLTIAHAALAVLSYPVSSCSAFTLSMIGSGWSPGGPTSSSPAPASSSPFGGGGGGLGTSSPMGGGSTFGASPASASVATAPAPSSTGFGIGSTGGQLAPSGPAAASATGSPYPKMPQTPIERAQSSDYYQNRGSETSNPSILIQGGSLKTWSFAGAYVERIQVVLTSNGRPIDGDIDLWQGPDNTPQKMRVYVEDGALRPLMVLLETPRGPNTVAIRNIGQLEFPFAATASANEIIAYPSDQCLMSGLKIQGGALKTFPFDPTVDSVQVRLSTEGRPLNARIELLQGPNNNKQVIELYCDDGLDRPFFCVLGTPGAGNVVRVVNTAPVEFPLNCAVVPNTILSQDDMWNAGVVIGGDTGW